MSEPVEAARQMVLAALPERMGAALEAYQRFTAEAPPDDAKGFAAWHAAAKAALSHVEVLVKLMRWADGGAEADGPAEDGMDRLLAQARDALDQLDEGDDEP